MTPCEAGASIIGRFLPDTLGGLMEGCSVPAPF